MNPTELIAFVSHLLSGAHDPGAFAVLEAGGADPGFPVIISECVAPAGPFELEGDTVACGTVSVPEDYDRPDGRRVELPFAVLRSHSLSPAADPVVYLHGGPGGGAVQDLAFVNELFETLRRTRDIVTFDQRAAGLASLAASCRQSLLPSYDQLLSLGESTDTDADTEEAETSLMMQMTEACLTDLQAAGIDITQYVTPNNARDVGSVMTALGYDSYNIYGVSYGTQLALEVMRTAPDGVRSIVLDSVAPPNVRSYDLLAAPWEEAAMVVFDQCAADDACNGAYPDLVDRFNALMDRLEATPIVDGQGADIDPERLSTYIRSRNDRTAPAGITGRTG